MRVALTCKCCRDIRTVSDTDAISDSRCHAHVQGATLNKQARDEQRRAERLENWVILREPGESACRMPHAARLCCLHG
jgi:hypothetical protein